MLSRLFGGGKKFPNNQDMRLLMKLCELNNDLSQVILKGGRSKSTNVSDMRGAMAIWQWALLSIICLPICPVPQTS